MKNLCCAPVTNRFIYIACPWWVMDYTICYHEAFWEYKPPPQVNEWLTRRPEPESDLKEYQQENSRTIWCGRVVLDLALVRANTGNSVKSLPIFSMLGPQ